MYAGSLCAGGTFTSPFPYIASWNGSNWSALAGGVSGSVSALLNFCAVGSGYYGPTCLPCLTAVNAASCSDGLDGDGALTCTDGWTGVLCDVCPSVAGYEGPMSGFDVDADDATSAQACLALDGSSLRNGWLVTYAGGLTACCLTKGSYDASLCTHGCNHDHFDCTDLFSLGAECFLDCFGVASDLCLVSAMVTNASPTLTGTTVALNGAWDSNQSTARTYAVLTANNSTALGAYGLDPSAGTAANAVALYCTGLGYVDASGPSCVMNTCGSSVSSAFAFVGDLPMNGAKCYSNCFAT